MAFSLGLCREVNRIYSKYQDDSLTPSDSLQAGLMVTIQMLAMLSHSVTEGMPGMRITVAAAQSREILAVMFGVDPLAKPIGRKSTERFRAIVTESVAAIEPTMRGLPAGGEAGRDGDPARRPGRLRRLFSRHR